jgi:hypothetical protein
MSDERRGGANGAARPAWRGPRFELAADGRVAARMGADNLAVALEEIAAAAAILKYRRRQRFESWLAGVRDTLSFLSRCSPFLTSDTMRQIRPPVELKMLKDRLERARQLQARTDVVGKRFDAALCLIEERLNQSEAHAENLETYSAELQQTIQDMLEGSNADPPTGGEGSPGSPG